MMLSRVLVSGMAVLSLTACNLGTWEPVTDADPSPVYSYSPISLCAELDLSPLAPLNLEVEKYENEALTMSKPGQHCTFELRTAEDFIADLDVVVSVGELEFGPVIQPSWYGYLQHEDYDGDLPGVWRRSAAYTKNSEHFTRKYEDANGRRIIPKESSYRALGFTDYVLVMVSLRMVGTTYIPKQELALMVTTMVQDTYSLAASSWQKS